MDARELQTEEVVDEYPTLQLIDDLFIKNLEKAASLYQERYLPICIKLTHPDDWINHGTLAEPHISLQCSGAEKLCNPFGIIWEAPIVTEHKLVDGESDFYEFEVSGIIKCHTLKRYGWFTGNCSSRDKFFTSRPGGFDKGDIRKAAFSNWLVNAVSRLIGLRNPSRTLLEKGGLKLDDIRSIDYSGKPEDPISQKQNGRLWAIIRDKKWTRPQTDALFSSFGYDDSRTIKKKDYDALIKAIEAGPQAQKPASQQPQQTSQQPQQSAAKKLMPLVGVIKLVSFAKKEGDASTLMIQTDDKKTFRISYKTPVGDLVGIEKPEELKDKKIWVQVEHIPATKDDKREWFVVRAFSLSDPATTPQTPQEQQPSQPSGSTIISQKEVSELALLAEENGLQAADVAEYAHEFFDRTLDTLTYDEADALAGAMKDGAVVRWMEQQMLQSDDGDDPHNG